MSELIIRNEQLTSALPGQFTNWLMSPTVGTLATLKRGVRVPSTEIVTREEWSFTVQDEDIRQMERMLAEAYQQLEVLMATRSELEIPEVFELHPLSSQRVTVKVRNRGPAPFYFIDDDM